MSAKGKDPIMTFDDIPKKTEQFGAVSYTHLRAHET